MGIREVMNAPAVTCQTDSTLDHAARLMWEFDCGFIPVVDRDGRLAGVVTDRDVCMAAYTQGRALRDIPVTSAMAPAVVAVHAEEEIDHAEQLMADNQIRRVPVLDRDTRVAGVLSMNDLARHADRVHRGAVDRELVHTLAAVGQPRTPGNGEARDSLMPRAGA